jgi:hypothetical protein
MLIGIWLATHRVPAKARGPSFAPPATLTSQVSVVHSPLGQSSGGQRLPQSLLLPQWDEAFNNLEKSS